MNANLIVDLYVNGYSISAIGEELMLPEDKITEEILSFKKKQDNGKDYIYDFKEMVVERIMSGVKRVTITRELGIAYHTINKYLEEFMIESPKSKRSLEGNMYDEIKWTSFKQCPSCLKTKVNDLNIYKEEGINLNHSYCLLCGTEWEQKSNKVFKINWAYVD